jgi:4-hydroxy-tetrahydrodipicolinate synthase
MRKMKTKKKQIFRGIVTPLVTPLRNDGELDTQGLANLIEHVLAGGVHGVFALGSSGEAPGLDYQTRFEVIERAGRQVGGRVPFLVGITDTSFKESVRQAEAAARAGADAVVAAPPYYFKMTQRELLEYFRRLAEAVPLPLFIYNLPSCTKVDIAPETVVRAMDVPGIIGLKDSSGDMSYFHKVKELCRERPDFIIMVGPEELLVESVLLGADGGVSGGSNLYPELYVRAYGAAAAGDHEAAVAAHHEIIRLSHAVYDADRKSGFYLKGLKHALELRGICAGALADPFLPLLPEEKKQVAAALKTLGLGVVGKESEKLNVVGAK